MGVLGGYSRKQAATADLRKVLTLPLLATEPAPRRVKQKYKRLTPKEVQALRVDYEANVPVATLADRYDISRPTVFEAVKDLPRRHSGLGPEEVARVIELYREGRSFVAIAEDLPVCAQTIRNVLLRAGVALRGRQGTGR